MIDAADLRSLHAQESPLVIYKVQPSSYRLGIGVGASSSEAVSRLGREAVPRP